MGSLPLENCIPGNAPCLGSLDAIVVGSLALSGLARFFPDDALRVSPASATGADFSGAAATGAGGAVAGSAAATGIAVAADAGAAGTHGEAAAVVSAAGAATTATAAAVATATGVTGAGATAAAEAAGETVRALTPDSIGTAGGLLATGMGDGSADGIGSEFAVGSTRTSDGGEASAAGEAIAAGTPDSVGTAGGLLATGAGDGWADGIGSELVVGSTRISDTWGASAAVEDAASLAIGGSDGGGAAAATGAVSAGMGGAGCEVATDGAAEGAVKVTGAVSAGSGNAGCEVATGGAAADGTAAACADGAGSVGADALAPASTPGLAVAPGTPPYTWMESGPWSKSSTEPPSGAGRLADGPDRIEAPALPGGARSWARTAPGSAIPSVPIAAIKMLWHRCDECAISALLGLATVLLGRDFGAYLLVQLEHASLRISRESNPDHLDPFTFQGNLPGRFHLIEVRQKAGAFSRYGEIAVLDNRTPA